MKNYFIGLFVLLFAQAAFAQNFEAPKNDGNDFTNVKVKIGADFALQVQNLSHKASNVELIKLRKNINQPTANMNIAADLAPGISVNLETYLSSRHHSEAWVKGGYLTIDRLPFLASDDFMKYFTLRAGVMMPNYGDAHFFRSDNGNVVNNPFVGNWIMDAFTTNPGMEIMWRKNGLMAMVGTNNGRLNYGRGTDLIDDLVYYWKLGFDRDLSDEMRFRATVSGYHVPEGHVGSYLYDGDRAGARYYGVMDYITTDPDGKPSTVSNWRSGRWSPGSGQSKMNNIMGNVFFKYTGLELFGMYERSKGIKKEKGQKFTQIAVQALYRLGSLYAGSRFNIVDDGADSDVKRLNIGGGWNMTDNIIFKVDYVNQTYNGKAFVYGDGAKFSGIVIEAAIHF